MHTTEKLQIERLPSVLARVGRSSASLYRDMAAGLFPLPVKLGARSVGWDARAVDRWISERFSGTEVAR